MMSTSKFRRDACPSSWDMSRYSRDHEFCERLSSGSSELLHACYVCCLTSEQVPAVHASQKQYESSYWNKNNEAPATHAASVATMPAG